MDVRFHMQTVQIEKGPEAKALFLFYKKRALSKIFCGVFISSYKVMKSSYLQIYKTFHSWFSLHIFCQFYEKKPFTQF